MLPKKKATVQEEASSLEGDKKPAAAPEEKKGPKTKPKKRKKKAIAWGAADDPCKELLTFDLVSGTVPPSMKPKEVYFLTKLHFSSFNRTLGND